MSWWWYILSIPLKIVTAPIFFIWSLFIWLLASILWHPSLFIWIPISILFFIKSAGERVQWQQRHHLFNFIFSVSMLLIQPGCPALAIFLTHIFTFVLSTLKWDEYLDRVPLDPRSKRVRYVPRSWGRFSYNYIDPQWPYILAYIPPVVAIYTCSLSLSLPISSSSSLLSSSSATYRLLYTLAYIAAVVTVYITKKQELLYFAAGRIVSSKKKEIDVTKSRLVHMDPETIPKRAPPLVSSILKATSHYEILDIPPSADDIVIKKAMRTMSLKVHPDKIGQEVPGANAASARVTTAAKELLDPVKRKEIDDTILRAAEAEAGVPDHLIYTCHCRRPHFAYRLDIDPTAARWCIECNKHHPVQSNTTWMHTSKGSMWTSYYFYMYDGKGVYDMTEIAECSGIMKLLDHGGDGDGVIYENPHGPSIFGGGDGDGGGDGGGEVDDLFDMLYRGSSGRGGGGGNKTYNNRKKKKKRYG